MGRKNHKMNRNIPIELVAELSNLADRIEQAIRKDERRKVREQLLAGLSETDGQQRGIGQRGKDRRPFRANSPLARVYRCLASRKHGINIRTIARESGLDQRAVQNAVHRLRKHGYSIQCNRAGYLRPKYRLAS